MRSGSIGVSTTAPSTRSTRAARACGRVVGDPPGRQRAVGDRGEVDRPPTRLGVGVDGERAGQQAQTPRRLGRARRRRHAALQPAHGARAEAREHDAALPGVAEQAVEAVHLPDGEQVAHGAAADVDDVLGEDDLAQRAAQVAHPEEREHLGLARPVAERRVEAADLVARVAAGRGQEEDPRHRRARELQDELVERRVARRGREAPAPQREDGPHATSASGAPRSTVGSLRSTTRSPRRATRQPRLPGREATTRCRSVPTKCSAAPSSAA